MERPRGSVQSLLRDQAGSKRTRPRCSRSAAMRCCRCSALALQRALLDDRGSGARPSAGPAWPGRRWRGAPGTAAVFAVAAASARAMALDGLALRAQEAGEDLQPFRIDHHDFVAPAAGRLRCGGRARRPAPAAGPPGAAGWPNSSSRSVASSASRLTGLSRKRSAPAGQRACAPRRSSSLPDSITTRQRGRRLRGLVLRAPSAPSRRRPSAASPCRAAGSRASARPSPRSRPGRWPPSRTLEGRAGQEAPHHQPSVLVVVHQQHAARRHARSPTRSRRRARRAAPRHRQPPPACGRSVSVSVVPSSAPVRMLQLALLRARHQARRVGAQAGAAALAARHVLLEEAAGDAPAAPRRGCARSASPGRRGCSASVTLLAAAGRPPPRSSPGWRRWNSTAVPRPARRPALRSEPCRCSVTPLASA